MPSDLLVFGDTAIDNFYEVDHLPKRNEAADVSSGRRFYGGMGANTAVVSAKLGMNTGLVSVIGTDAEDYRNYMSTQGIKLYLKGIFGDTTKSMFFKTKKEQISFFYKGVTEQLDELDPFQEFSGNLPKKIKCIFMARTYLEMQKRVLREYEDTFSVCNPGYGVFELSVIPRAFQTIMRNISVIVLNHHELDHLKSIGYTVRLKPNQKMIITRGDAGARVYYRDTITDVPAYKTKAVDASGAGDAFNAGFIAAHLKGYDIFDSVKFGNATSSFIVEEWGCQTNIPSFDQVVERYKRIR